MRERLGVVKRCVLALPFGSRMGMKKKRYWALHLATLTFGMALILFGLVSLKRYGVRSGSGGLLENIDILLDCIAFGGIIISIPPCVISFYGAGLQTGFVSQSVLSRKLQTGIISVSGFLLNALTYGSVVLLGSLFGFGKHMGGAMIAVAACMDFCMILCVLGLRFERAMQFLGGLLTILFLKPLVSFLKQGVWFRENTGKACLTGAAILALGSLLQFLLLWFWHKKIISNYGKSKLWRREK